MARDVQNLSIDFSDVGVVEGHAVRTGEMIEVLRTEGFNITPAYLDFLLRERHFLPPVKTAAGYEWGAPDLARLRSVLRRRNRGPQQALNELEGVRR